MHVYRCCAGFECQDQRSIHPLSCSLLVHLIKLDPCHPPQQKHVLTLAAQGHRPESAAPAKVCSRLLDVAVVERGSQGQQWPAGDQLHDKAARVLHAVHKLSHGSAHR